MSISLKPGETFNPYRMFTGLFIPEGLARCDWISAGAKLAWGRLARYAGEDGYCYPTVRTLASEIGVGLRQAQRYLTESERARLIRRVSRFDHQAQTSNAFAFLWHELFDRAVTDLSWEGVTDDSPRGVTDWSPKESQTEESHSEESQKNRLRLSAHESQKSQFVRGVPAESCAQYPKLREALADYMQEPGQERVYGSDRQVVDIMDGAEGATEEEVIRCLRYLYHERGLKPGTKNGPRHFSWFRTAVRDYFRQKRRFQEAEPATAGREVGLSKAVFDAMTEAIEIEAWP